jgi:hypothetical protein
MLDAFPELFRYTKFWEADPIVGGGYARPLPEDIHEYGVIVLDDLGDAVKRKPWNFSFMALDTENNDVMYSYDYTPIRLGMFMIHPDTGEVHRVARQLNHNYTGGFCSWGITRVQGANGLNDDTLQLSNGVF